MISAIACVDRNWGIGYNGELLTKIPEDMRFFKEKTTNNVVIMGRKTYDSLLLKPLPNRINIVITSKIDKPCVVNEEGIIFVTMDFIKEFLHTLSSGSLSDCFDYYIIGGGQIYEELLPYCNISYITKVNYAYQNVDTYFPNLDKKEEWIECDNIKRKENKTCDGIQYRFCVYERI